jgi:hypothetical protein
MILYLIDEEVKPSVMHLTLKGERESFTAAGGAMARQNLCRRQAIEAMVRRRGPVPPGSATDLQRWTPLPPGGATDLRRR